MPAYSFEGLRPVVDPTAFVHPTAVLIGDVEIGAACYVGPGAVLRGDFGRLVLEQGSNLQDNCVMHSFPGREGRVEQGGHVGHGAVLHGCRIGPNALIGMNAVIMDNAEIGANGIIGAMSFVKAGTITPPGSLWMGAPARLIREITAQERAWKARGTAEYQALAKRCLSGLAECEPLVAYPSEQRSVMEDGHRPLDEIRSS